VLWKGSSSCSTSGTRRVNLVTNPVISHGREKDRKKCLRQVEHICGHWYPQTLPTNTKKTTPSQKIKIQYEYLRDDGSNAIDNIQHMKIKWSKGNNGTILIIHTPLCLNTHSYKGK
jgi:hypothetical protein